MSPSLDSVSAVPDGRAAIKRRASPPARRRRRLPPTREGWWYLAATLAVGLVAINAGVNLLFLVWGMMLALVLASGSLAETCLRNLHAERSPPTTVHAGTPFLMGISLANRKRRLPSFSVEVEDMMQGQPADKRCFFLKLPAGRVQQTSYRQVIAQRGLCRFDGFRISTKFPFGLIRKTRVVAAPLELLVLPHLVPLPEALRRELAAGRGQGAGGATRTRSGEFAALREFRQGDDPRQIHWRVTARRGRPMVRESEEAAGASATIVLENGPVAGGVPPETAAQQLEEAVSLAASVTVDLIRRGHAVALVARGVVIPHARGPAHSMRILRCLALIDRAREDQALVEPRSAASRIVITPGSAPVAFTRATTTRAAAP